MAALPLRTKDVDIPYFVQNFLLALLAYMESAATHLTFAPADYREGSPLECLVKNIIDRTETNEALERKYFQCFEEMSEEWKSKNKNEIHKNELIAQLEESRSFANTHKLISQIEGIEGWDDTQKGKLVHIALTNTQVKYILTDTDIRRFFSGIINGMETEEIKELREKMEV